MELNNYGNLEVKLPDSITELIAKCFNELNKVLQEKNIYIESEFKMAQKWGGEINVQDIMNKISDGGKEIVAESRRKFEMRIKEIWERVMANELSTMEHRGVSNGDLMSIRDLANKFINNLIEDLNETKTKLLSLLKDKRCIKYFKRYN